MTVDREVQDHRNVCAAKGTGEGVFHDTSTLPHGAADDKRLAHRLVVHFFVQLEECLARMSNGS